MNTVNYKGKYFKIINMVSELYKVVESMEHVEVVEKAVSLATIKEMLDKILKA